MFFSKFIARAICIVASTTFLLPLAHAQKRPASFVSDDAAFQALRDASRRGDILAADGIAATLANYPIPSYVEYYRLKPHLRDATPQDVQAFFARYPGTAIADRLRNDWLLELGRRRDWTNFDQQYPLFVLNDDTQVKCYALMSKASKGINVAADTRALLNIPRDVGDGCIALVAQLLENGQFESEDVWTQVRRAAETGSADYVRRFAALADVDDKLLVQAMDDPGKLLKRGAGFRRVRHEVYVIALGRLARTDWMQAAEVLSHNTLLLNKKQEALAWAQIALPASRNGAPQALEYWRKAGDAVPLTTEGYQWRVRAALRAGEWKQVRSYIEAMPTGLQDDPAWIYWMARAMREAGQTEEANARFTLLAPQAHFYGQLATEELGQPITIPPRAAPPTAEEILPMARNEGFQRALKFFDLNMRPEGYREWNWELRGMTDRQLLAAAEFARRQNVLDRMVNTSDRTRNESDYTQRFPSPHREAMQVATQRTGLEMAWVYGLIRQESRFVHDARSQVGASGLMQLMPGTARYVAKKIGMNDFTPAAVNDVQTNLLLGASYLAMALNDLDGSEVLATAAYNAGPRRAVAWRATLGVPMEGAMFAELIPFTETRDYVKKVMSNATYYAALFEDKPQSLKARLGTIAPRAPQAIDLP
ncbi:MAG TPA: transglycosylase SLT domain-containing protein [Oxalicibacterium sp.]|nr:transglycosylase SLT domain-containing protein [Oxalicibacterium sp.]